MIPQLLQKAQVHSRVQTPLTGTHRTKTVEELRH